MKRDDVTMQLISSSLAYASEEMGLALRNAAYSPNIKERMDHSAAIFDSEGRLLAQAEHIPVHLGSLPWGLRNLIELCKRRGPTFEEGSMIMSNDPYICGTHLNDVTVVCPVYSSGSLVAFAANKAHHADVGGKVPGSISMGSSTLFEEGTVVEPTRLTTRREFVPKTLEEFSSASRTPGERRGDLRAQVAANLTGERRVHGLIAKYGLGAFRAAGKFSFAHSETMMRRRLSAIRRGLFTAEEVLEGADGTDLRLRVAVRVLDGEVEVDYAGTAVQVDYPLNSVFGVTISGVYYVLRTLTGDDIPANHGAFAPIRVSAPPGTILNPTSPHPVGGGNVETSQRNADLIYRALSKAAPRLVPAAAGGSMNNVMVGGQFSGSQWAFYETMGVGLGGSSERDGIDGIQCNMTNTMNTPIEEIERSLPLMITKYEFRPDSSGAGRFRGGSGLVRRYRILSPGTTFTILAERERHAPWGLLGGGTGGRTEVILNRGEGDSRIPSKSTLVLDWGDEVEIRTAGGGGYGNPLKRPRSSVREDVVDGLLTPVKARMDYGLPRRPRRMSSVAFK
ncbi:MAG TPA: hydantoinase B/oxoprolinase family protein [Nitrososphaerales archaeon]|nr:hydantoinase B/oxoprolinase family protein [Nitrososphaerales archaeon]